MNNFPQLLDFVLRLTVILSVGLGIVGVLRRASAAERHLVLLGVVVASLLLPAGLLLVPRFSIPVPVSDAPSVLQTAVVVLSSSPTTSTAPAPQAVQEHRNIPFPGWTECLLLIAVAGALVQAARMVFGFLSLRRIGRESTPFAVPASAEIAARSIAGLGYLPPVRLAATVSIPFLRGWQRPSLILPARASGWPEHKLVMVLAHEMAHIRRRDHQWQPVLLLFRLLYWWHPLARLVIAQTLQERERACDDIVLSGDVRASDYARLLVETAGAAPVPAIALAMASSSRITGRVRKILSIDQRRAPVSRFFLGLITSVSLGLFAAVSVAGLRAEEKPQAAPSPDAAPPRIEIECKILQVSEEAFQQNREFFDSAVKATTAEAMNDFLKKLNTMKGLDLLSAPKVTTQFGKKTVIKVVRNFPFPEGFDKDGKPTSFKSRDLGVNIELEASENNGKIRLSGTFFLTEILGFIEGGEIGAQSPTFQTREVHFLREQPSGIPSLFLAPGQVFIPGQVVIDESRSASTAGHSPSLPPPSAYRMMFWTKATVVEDEAFYADKGLLQEAILHDVDYRDEPMDKVINDILAKLSQGKLFTNLQGELAAKFTFKAQAISVADLFAKIREQTGYLLWFTPSGLSVNIPANTTHSNSSSSNELRQEPGLSIGDVQLRDGAPGTKVLQIATKAKPGSSIDARNLKLHVFFYEKDEKGEVQLTGSRASTNWITPPVDWKDDETESVDVTYTLPDNTGPFSTPGRQFAGYVTGIYYNGKLQDTRAEPGALAEKFPLPPSLKQDSP